MESIAKSSFFSLAAYSPATLQATTLILADRSDDRFGLPEMTSKVEPISRSRSVEERVSKKRVG